VFWIKKTIKKVTIVVAVLITSCHELLKLKMGPVVTHIITRTTAITKAVGRPTVKETHLAKRENLEVRYTFLLPPSV
jgi:hypothetical protein